MANTKKQVSNVLQSVTSPLVYMDSSTLPLAKRITENLGAARDTAHDLASALYLNKHVRMSWLTKSDTANFKLDFKIELENAFAAGLPDDIRDYFRKLPALLAGGAEVRKREQAIEHVAESMAVFIKQLKKIEKQAAAAEEAAAGNVSIEEHPEYLLLDAFDKLESVLSKPSEKWFKGNKDKAQLLIVQCKNDVIAAFGQLPARRVKK